MQPSEQKPSCVNESSDAITRSEAVKSSSPLWLTPFIVWDVQKVVSLYSTFYQSKPLQFFLQTFPVARGANHHSLFPFVKCSDDSEGRNCFQNLNTSIHCFVKILGENSVYRCFGATKNQKSASDILGLSGERGRVLVL
jgi:hypothetical protein